MVAQIKNDADGDEGSTDRRRIRRDDEEMIENDNYNEKSDSEYSSGDDREAYNKSSRTPNERTSMKPGSDTDAIGDPVDDIEPETIRDVAGDGSVTSTGHSRGADQKESSSVRSTRSKRKKNKS